MSEIMTKTWGPAPEQYLRQVEFGADFLASKVDKHELRFLKTLGQGEGAKPFKQDRRLEDLGLVRRKKFLEVVQ